MLSKFFINKIEYHPITTSYIKYIYDNPALFQISNEILRNVYLKHNEPLGHEYGFAFNEIIHVLTEHGGWILLEYIEDQGIWKIKCFDLKKHKETLIHFFSRVCKAPKEEFEYINDIEEEDGFKTLNLFLKV